MSCQTCERARRLLPHKMAQQLRELERRQLERKRQRAAKRAAARGA